ncbi:MAG: aldo/keto reductase [Saccharofermentans sp.]|nr:aldo/keto reductase [Saccharofermentans sp.]
MQYRKNNISILGYGCMRFTTKAGKIDLEKAEKEVLTAIENGVNLFDTAYIYPGSEDALGKIISKNNLRDKVLIQTKLPQYLCGSRKALDKYFNEELSRLKTDYVDYYLMHHMTDYSTWEKLQAIGIEDWIAEKKASGQIRHIGFSFHGNSDAFIKILNAYEWDSCLVQYNYMDEHTQAGRKGIEAAAAKGIPVFIMEPLRGGKLVDLLPDKAKKEIAAHPSGRTPAEWAFRWLWNQEGVSCVLSGMNSVEMVTENARIAADCLPNSFTEDDNAMIDKIKGYIQQTTKVNCTGCRYCMPCPVGIDIPALFRCYNHMYSEGKGSGRNEYVQSVSLMENSVFADKCIKCGKCEKHCPQELKIRDLIQEADKKVRPWYYKIAIGVMRKVMLKKKS